MGMRLMSLIVSLMSLIVSLMSLIVSLMSRMLASAFDCLKFCEKKGN